MSEVIESLRERWHTAAEVRRLGKNVNGYLGETIELNPVLRDSLAMAGVHGWQVEELPAFPKPNLLALKRGSALGVKSRAKIYLSAGIHGDEPAGPMAVLQLLAENAWDPAHELWICPCLNPTGFLLNRRENGDGADLNRQYLKPTAEETVAHIRWLEQQPNFDVCFCLHEDWESHGFYLYELDPENRRPGIAERMIQRVESVCPIDRSDLIEGRPARDGIIRPSTDARTRPLWPEAFWLLTHRTPVSYTLEAPSDYPLPARVASLVTAVRAALELL